MVLASFANVSPEGSVVRLYSFTGGAFIAEALSDASGQGTFHTERPLVSLEELGALNESNGKVGPHRYVHPLPSSTQTPTPTPPAKVPTGSAAWVLSLLILGLAQRALQKPVARGRS
jgi:hypothetical protein